MSASGPGIALCTRSQTSAPHWFKLQLGREQELVIGGYQPDGSKGVDVLAHALLPALNRGVLRCGRQWPWLGPDRVSFQST
jgi:hypothetical protein